MTVDDLPTGTRGFDDLGQHSLGTKEGFAAFAAQTMLEPPHLLPAADRARLTAAEEEVYKDVRQRFQSQLLLSRFCFLDLLR